MPFKFNIGSKDGKSWKFELENEEIIGKTLGEKIKGEDLLPGLKGYEFEITGASDKAGLPSLETIDGVSLKRVLLYKGKGVYKKPKGLKKKRPRAHKGLKLRKTVRGKVISPDMVQINLKVLKEGHEKLVQVFADQNSSSKVKENRAFKRKQKKESPKEKETKQEAEESSE